MDEFASRAPELLSTIKAITQVKGGPLSTLLREASAELLNTGYDNWNGGTDLYAFQITIPAAVFAAFEDAQEELETEILDRLKKLIRDETNIWVNEVILRPAAPSDMHPDVPGEGDELWDPGDFRLFLSHHSSKKEGVAQLRDALRAYCISGFVAHTDIEPTKQWESQIEAALRSMDALAAVLSPEFVSSRWCDQEVGFAMGRKRLVIPLRAGADPHGFLGKYQGLQVRRRPAKELADEIFAILARHDLTRRRIAEVLINSLLDSDSWEWSRDATALLARIPSIDRDLLDHLGNRWEDNPKIVESYTVPGRIKKLISA